MYVCLCHGFTDRQVKSAIAEGQRSVADVYARLGVRPRCGKCVGEVRAMVAGAPCAGVAERNAAGALAAPQTE
ncbi:MAG: (2Fe-2S)-binding protein [Rhodospirillaceae bacterium]|nr:(2Fe-2S)-binding protein [Rhodospirillaceae bacterium]